MPVIAEEQKAESDDEMVLPINERKHIGASIKNNEWLKMFRQKNSMHDGNREGAKSLSENIAFDYWTYKENKFFNKLPVVEKLIDYPYSELVQMGQAPEGS